MKRKVTVQSVIIHFYALYLKKQPSSAELLREANLIIEKCNKHILQEGDKYLSDTIKQVNTVDYDYWMRVFPLPKKVYCPFKQMLYLINHCFKRFLQENNTCISRFACIYRRGAIMTGSEESFNRLFIICTIFN